MSVCNLSKLCSSGIVSLETVEKTKQSTPPTPIVLFKKKKSQTNKKQTKKGKKKIQKSQL